MCKNYCHHLLDKTKKLVAKKLEGCRTSTKHMRIKSINFVSFSKFYGQLFSLLEVIKEANASEIFPVRRPEYVAHKIVEVSIFNSMHLLQKDLFIKKTREGKLIHLKIN